MKQKRKVIIAAFVCAAALLIGWKIKPVELIDDKLLIDLDTTIVEAGWGQEGNPTDNPDDPKEDGDKESGDGGTTDTPNPDEKGTILVSVRGEQIYLDGVTVRDVATLRTRLSQKVKSDSSIVLEDNYAEAHVYKDALQMLEMMQTLEHFKLSEIAR